MVKVLITGAGGFCARHLIRRLSSDPGVRLWGTDLRAEAPQHLDPAHFRPLDIGEPGPVESLVHEVMPDTVFHLAGCSSGSDAAIHRVNLLGTVHLLEALHRHTPAARVLLMGSAAEYGAVPHPHLPVTEEYPCRPMGAYGVSKHAATLVAVDYARRVRLKVVIARPFNIIGAGLPDSLLVGALLERAKEALQSAGEPVVRVGNLDSERDFISVDDVVDACLRIIQTERWGEVFNICSGLAYSIRQIAAMLLANAPRPMRLMVDLKLRVPGEVDILFGSWEKAGRAFGFRPRVRIEEALRAAWRDKMKREAHARFPPGSGTLK